MILTWLCTIVISIDFQIKHVSVLMFLMEMDMTKWAWSKRWGLVAPSVWMNTDGSTVPQSESWNRVRPDDFGDIFFSAFGFSKMYGDWLLHSSTGVYRHTCHEEREKPNTSSAAPAHLETQTEFEWQHCLTNLKLACLHKQNGMFVIIKKHSMWLQSHSLCRSVSWTFWR